MWRCPVLGTCLIYLLVVDKVVQHAHAGNDKTLAAEVELFKYLGQFDIYVPPIARVTDLDELVVNITIEPNNIFGLSMDQNSELWVDLLLCIAWNSSALTWKPSDFGNLSYVSLTKSAVWTPLLATGMNMFLETREFEITSMSPIMLRWDGYTHWCPQTRLPIPCILMGMSEYDIFPVEVFYCETTVDDQDTLHGQTPVNIKASSFRREDFRREGDLFGDSGFNLDYVKTVHKSGRMNTIVIGISRNSLQWFYQMTLPVILISLLCLINLWLNAVPGSGQHPGRRLASTFVLIIIISVQIQLYSPSLAHCWRPPFILALLAYLASTQLVFATLYILLVRIDTGEHAWTLYQQAEQVYRYSVVQMYVERVRTTVFTWTSPKPINDDFGNNLDPQEGPFKNRTLSVAEEAGSLAQVIFLFMRLVLTAVIVVYLGRFGCIFL